jgi:hypothetical protein
MGEGAEVPMSKERARRGEEFPIQDYCELTDGERAVDAHWYMVLLTSIEGSMTSTCQTEGQQSFIHAFTALAEALNLSAHSTKMGVMNELAGLRYDGDPENLLMVFGAVAQKVYDTKITIADVVMQRLMELVQRSNTTRLQVAKFIQDGDANDLPAIKKCLLEVARLLQIQNSASSHGVNMMRNREEDEFGSSGTMNSKQLNSLAKKIFALQNKAAAGSAPSTQEPPGEGGRPSGEGGQIGWYAGKNCFDCGEPGHIARNCIADSEVKKAYSKKYAEEKAAKKGAEGKKMFTLTTIAPVPEGMTVAEFADELDNTKAAVQGTLPPPSEQDDVEIGASTVDTLFDLFAITDSPGATGMGARTDALAKLNATIDPSFWTKAADAVINNKVTLTMIEYLYQISNQVQQVQRGIPTAGYTVSMLDSGSAVNACGVGVVPHLDGSSITAQGFNGSQHSSNGAGMVQTTVVDAATGQAVELPDVKFHEMSVLEPGQRLYSVGKLVNTGHVRLELEKGKCVGIHIPTQTRFPVYIGQDNIVYMVHAADSGSESAGATIQWTRKVNEQVSADYVHRLFNHVSEARMETVLAAVDGVTLIPGSTMANNCSGCMAAMVPKSGKQALVTSERPPVVDDGVVEQDESSSIAQSVQPARSPSPPSTQQSGSAKRPAPRNLRPLEDIWVDNKTCNGHKFLLILCFATGAIWAPTVLTKAGNGDAFTRFACNEGIQHLGYQPVVHGDGCGSIAVNLRSAAEAVGCKFIPTPVDDQSLNHAESAIRYCFGAATAHMHENPELPRQLFPYVVFQTCWLHNRTAGGKRREYMTPFELLGKGTDPIHGDRKPNLCKAVPIGTDGFIRKKHDERGRAPPGKPADGAYDPLPSELSLKVKFLCFAGMWDESSHRTWLVDRITGSGNLLIRTTRNHIYTHRRYNMPAHLPIPPIALQTTGTLVPDAAVAPTATGINVGHHETGPASDDMVKAGAERGNEGDMGQMETLWEESDDSDDLDIGHDGFQVTPTAVQVPSSIEAPFLADTTQEFKFVNKAVTDMKLAATAAAQSVADSVRSGNQTDDAVYDQHRNQTAGPAPDRHTDNQTDRQTDNSKQTAKQTDRQNARPTSKQTDRQTTRSTTKPTDGQLDQPTDRQTDQQTDGDTAVTAEPGPVTTDIGSNASASGGAAETTSRLHRSGTTYESGNRIDLIRMGTHLARDQDWQSLHGLTDRLIVDDLVCLMDELPGTDFSARSELLHIFQVRHINAAKRKHNSKADMRWGPALQDPTLCDRAIAALTKECDALKASIFTELEAGTPEFELAHQTGTRSRPILSEKRNGNIKCRIVKRGDLEDKVMEDGPGFNYSAQVASLCTFRLCLSCAKNSKEVCVIDVSTAFLQSHKFPEGKVKYTYFTDPVTGQLRCFRADGPQYGESSAPAYWKATITEYMEGEGFREMKNAPSTFLNDSTGVTLILYVDDACIIGEHDAIVRFLKGFTSRFVCKEEEWLTEDSSIDLLGILVRKQLVDGKMSIVLSMEPYIDHLLQAIPVRPNARVTAPIVDALHCHCVPPQKCSDCWRLKPLNPHQKQRYMSGVGGIGWLVATTRPDLLAAHCRLSQYMVEPTLGCLAGIEHVMQYLHNTKSLCLVIPWDGVDGEWRFYADSDHAGNKELVNRLRAQCCSMALHRNCLVHWHAGISKTAMACKEIGTAHSDKSSGASETYGAGEACMKLLPLKHLCQEMGIPFPIPIPLQLDATTAQAFMKGTCRRSKMMHIDQAQEWVITMRDAKLFTAVDCDTGDNPADMGTKLQGGPKLQPLITLVGMKNVPLDMDNG